jgi:glycosyltransferase involved in cell wall biosynthesis
VRLPFVSVIVPCLNRKAWLQEAIRALRAQTYPSDRFEIIVVDNGSNDGTWEWLEEAATECNPPLQRMRNETSNRTHAGSRNVGLRHALGEIIAFTDSDCIAAAEWLESGVAGFQTGVGLIVGRTISPPGDPVGLLSRIRITEGEDFFDTCNIFYSKEAIDRVGGFDVGADKYSFMVYGEDSDLGIRVKKAGYRSAFQKDAVVMHRVRQLSVWEWLIEPRVLLFVPYLVKKHPAVRHEMLYCRYFLTPQTARFNLLLAGLIFSVWISPWFMVLAGPFLFFKVFEGGRHRGFVMGALRVLGGTVRAFGIFVVLLYSSVRYRSVVI